MGSKFSNVSVPAETIILGCFGVVFWPELPQNLSILFEILSSDDMKDNASGMLQFLLKYQEVAEIGPKEHFSFRPSYTI